MAGISVDDLKSAGLQWFRGTAQQLDATVNRPCRVLHASICGGAVADTGGVNSELHLYEAATVVGNPKINVHALTDDSNAFDELAPEGVRFSLLTINPVRVGTTGFYEVGYLLED